MAQLLEFTPQHLTEFLPRYVNQHVRQLQVEFLICDVNYAGQHGNLLALHRQAYVVYGRAYCHANDGKKQARQFHRFLYAS